MDKIIFKGIFDKFASSNNLSSIEAANSKMFVKKMI
jgi:hypothetical protein